MAEPVAGLESLPPGEGPEVCPVGFLGVFRVEFRGACLAVCRVEFPAVEFPVAVLRVGLPVELPPPFLLVKT